MPTQRKFCRFSARAEGNPAGISQIPESGFCLNVFLIVSPSGDPTRVLMGRLDPSAAWDHLGGLDAGRATAHAGGWMLPASQLIFGEAPDEAVRRLDHELLQDLAVEWSAPAVLSEVYRPRRHPESGEHWDLGFVYRGLSRDAAPASGEIWRELSYLDPAHPPASGFARAHEDVLEFAGFSPRR